MSHADGPAKADKALKPGKGWLRRRHGDEHRLLPWGPVDESDPTLAPILLDHERRTQRLTALIRLAIGPLFFAVVRTSGMDPIMDSSLVIYSPLSYMAIAILSLIASHPRYFRPYWAPVFIVLDVIWYEAVLLTALILFEMPIGAYASLPLSILIFFFLALAGMRFSPKALLAGLITFCVLDGVILAVYFLGLMPIDLFDPRPYFSIGANMARITILCGVGLVSALTCWRSRQTLIHALNESRARERTYRLVGHFVPPAVADEMLKSDGYLKPASRDATILYSDIQGFTAIVERLLPETVVTMLDEYFSAVEKAIAAEGGVVTQFQGDAVLATFNLPLIQEDHADRALRAARSIFEITQNRTFAGERLPTRVGVNTGPVVSGTVSGVERVGYTVHGDAVNLAARLEAKNKDLGTWVILSDSTVECLNARVGLIHVGAEKIRGRSTPVDIYTIETPGPGSNGRPVGA
ncbi:MAG: adenylate/guanylate cyclase domain-containing protein [Rhodospirillales bacterium]|nr:adenylate/guanylate cyclase domain-containing protein [Rhodospirillales bacterium]